MNESARPHFNPQHWLLCHMGLFSFELEFALPALLRRGLLGVGIPRRCWPFTTSLLLLGVGVAVVCNIFQMPAGGNGGLEPEPAPSGFAARQKSGALPGKRLSGRVGEVHFLG